MPSACLSDLNGIHICAPMREEANRRNGPNYKLEGKKRNFRNFECENMNSKTNNRMEDTL